MLDPKRLKKNDVIVFGGVVEKIVQYDIEPKDEVVWFPDGTTRLTDSLWQIAELKKRRLPALFSMDFDNESRTAYRQGHYIYSAARTLFMLKSDVAALEAAGVKPE